MQYSHSNLIFKYKIMAYEKSLVGANKAVIVLYVPQLWQYSSLSVFPLVNDLVYLNKQCRCLATKMFTRCY